MKTNKLQWHPNIKFRLADSFISSSLYNMLLPFLPLYFSEKHGTATAGILLSLYFVTGIITNLLFGQLSDRIGRKNTLVYMGYIRTFSFFIIFINSLNIYSLDKLSYIMFLLISMSNSISSPANQALILESSTNEQRRSLYSIEYWLQNLALFLGILIGSFLYNNLIALVFFGCFVASVISLLIALIFITESNSSKEMNLKKQNPLKEFRDNLITISKNNKFILAILANFLLLSTELQTMNYLLLKFSDKIKEINIFNQNFLGTEFFGILRAENTLIIVFLGIFWNQFGNKFDVRKTLILGIILYAGGFSVIVGNSNPYLLFIIMLIITLGEMLYIPLKKVIIVQHIPEHNKAAYLSVNNLIPKLAAVSASLMISFMDYIQYDIQFSILIIIFGSLGCLMYLKSVKGVNFNGN
ncbi:MFS transporter [Viridibacillus arvi]|uniref:MFS transporter n=1 Tax=Viridibacillus arvi TaxID=263475 RepID=UPI003D283348